MLKSIAAAAARDVGAQLREAFKHGVEATSKRDFHDLVTDCDRAAEERLRSLLTEEVPGSSFLGEEGGLVGTGDVTWCVDPIDGTNNFVAGVPFFCVSIAAMRGDSLLAGVVYDPIRDELFAADAEGADCNGEPLVSTGATEDADAVLATDFPTHRSSVLAGGGISDLERFGEFVRAFRSVRRLGSGALTLAYVASGRIDATLGVDAKPWDVAAGALLVERAGGTYHAFPSSGPPWEAGLYVAHVGGFELGSSCLATVCANDCACSQQPQT